MSDQTATMLIVGDLIFNEPQPEHYLELAAPVLKTADVVVGQGEVVYTDRHVDTYAEMFAPAKGIDPSHMSGFTYGGFNVITLAGNHVWDSGAPGIEDTIAVLHKNGIATAGAGMNLDEARRPAVIERKGTRFGFLSYNCIGPMGTWATAQKPGCAYVHIITHYETEFANPGGEPVVYTFAEPSSLKAMIDDIQQLRSRCDVLTVIFHKGLLNMPDKLAMYDQQVSYAAIDAGADLVVGHHAHVVQGIEQYKGKTIFHGIGNFVWPAVGTGKGKITSLAVQLGVQTTLASFRRGADLNERKKALIAKCVIDNGKISRLSYLPCLINDQGQTEILGNDPRGQQVVEFMDQITRAAGLNTCYAWEGDEVTIHAAS